MYYESDWLASRAGETPDLPAFLLPANAAVSRLLAESGVPLEKNGKDTALSYTSLNSLVSAVAAAIPQPPGKKRTGIYCKDPLYAAAALYAVWRNANAVVVFSARHPAQFILEQSRRAECDTIITDCGLQYTAPDAPRCFEIGDILRESDFTAVTAEPAEQPPHQSALLLFTSGSSGRSKLVEHTFDSLLMSAVSGREMFHYHYGDRWLLVLPHYHIGGLSILLRSLLFGSSVYLPAPDESADLYALIEEKQVTLTSLVSVQLKRLLSLKKKSPSSLRALLVGGGPVKQELLTEGLALGYPLYKVYGSTETSAFVTALKPGDIPAHPYSAGRPLSGVKIIIVDDDGSPLSSGETGEITIRTQALMKDYIDSEIVEKAMRGRTFHTGDFGRLDKDGFLYVTGRKSDILITGGMNVDSVEVEKALKALNGVHDAAVAGIDDPEWGDRVVAAVVMERNETLDEQAIRTELREMLAGYKVPKQLAAVDHLPVTSLGKIDKDAVRKLFSERQ